MNTPAVEITTDVLSNEAQREAVERDPMKTALAVAGVDDKGFWTSMKPESEREIATLHKAINGIAANVSEAINQVIDVQNVVFHKVEVEDEATKELKTLTRMVLISPRGDTMATCSTGALNSFMLLLQIAGVPPWNPAKNLKIHQIATRRKRRTFSFEYIPPELPEKADEKPKKPAK